MYINDLSANQKGTSVDLSTYNSSNQFTLLSDGYVIADGATHAGTGTLYVLGAGSGSGRLIGGLSIISGEQSMLFVKKGMTVYVIKGSGNPTFTYVALS